MQFEEQPMTEDEIEHLKASIPKLKKTVINIGVISFASIIAIAAYFYFSMKDITFVSLFICGAVIFEGITLFSLYKTLLKGRLKAMDNPQRRIYTTSIKKKYYRKNDYNFSVVWDGLEKNERLFNHVPKEKFSMEPEQLNEGDNIRIIEVPSYGLKSIEWA